ncbi:MAG: hypothetical protein AB9891_21385 [Anaerolineaceae bacterium]
MAKEGQSKIPKRSLQSPSHRDRVEKIQVYSEKPQEFSPPLENKSPLLSQQLEFDWDESLIPVSLASINYPARSNQFHSVRVNAAVSQSTIITRTSSSEEKNFSIRKY